MTFSRARADDGAILVEAAMGLLPFCLAVVLSLEIVRLAQWEALFHVLACRVARDAALGTSERESRRKTDDLLRRIYGTRGMQSIREALDVTATPRPWGVVGRVHVRYRSFLTFELERDGQSPGRRHHLEMTQSCTFPW